VEGLVRISDAIDAATARVGGWVSWLVLVMVLVTLLWSDPR
jgi:TRAP-type mannitol/chloroaromatic compound transport system permease small subunit